MRNEAFANDVVEAFVLNGPLSRIERFVEELRNPPGRPPSAKSLRVAEILRALSDEDAALIARDIVDAATFSIVYLLNEENKAGFKTTFSRDGERWSPEPPWLTEAYRMRVDPGGVLYDLPAGTIQ